MSVSKLTLQYPKALLQYLQRNGNTKGSAHVVFWHEVEDYKLASDLERKQRGPMIYSEGLLLVIFHN